MEVPQRTEEGLPNWDWQLVDQQDLEAAMEGEGAARTDGRQVLVKVRGGMGPGEQDPGAQNILLVASAGPVEDWAGVEAVGEAL